MNNNLHELGKQNVENFKEFKGIGEAKAISIIAAMELGRRRNQSTALELDKITCSNDVANYLRPLMGDLDHEVFWVLFLNRKNKITDKQQLSEGGITGTVIDVRRVLKVALEKHATSLIIAHNHPSGNVDPSPEDQDITKRLQQAGEIIGIDVLDHLVIAKTKYYSFLEHGLM